MRQLNSTALPAMPMCGFPSRPTSSGFILVYRSMASAGHRIVDCDVAFLATYYARSALSLLIPRITLRCSAPSSALYGTVFLDVPG
jgi:hypothetical protein